MSKALRGLVVLVSSFVMLMAVIAYASTTTVKIEPNNSESTASQIDDSKTEVTVYYPFSAFD